MSKPIKERKCDVCDKVLVHTSFYSFKLLSSMTADISADNWQMFKLAHHICDKYAGDPEKVSIALFKQNMGLL